MTQNDDSMNGSGMATSAVMQQGGYSTLETRPLDHMYGIHGMNQLTRSPATDPMLGGHSAVTTETGQPSMNRSGRPYIHISEQPRSRGLRFRYKCEGRSAGTIPGENSTNENRVYPTIKICNYSGPSAIVVVSCVTKDDPPRPHPHSLVGKDCKQGVCTVKLKGTTTVSFPSLGIQCATKKEIQEALKQREKIRVDPWGTGYYKNWNSIELSTVRLAFQAFLPDESGKYTRIVQPTVSHCIYDKKAVTDLVVCRLSKQSGNVKGGDEIFLLCEKVTKDDIQVRFFEENKDEGVIWEKYGIFGQQDVHRQVAIVFKTPEYKDQNIVQPVTVHMQLRRPSDDEFSEPKPFQYIPNDPDPDFVGRKRKRKTMNFDNFLKDYKVPNNYQPASLPPVSNKDSVREKLRKKINQNQVPARVSDQTGVSSENFQLQHYSFDTLGQMAAAPSNDVMQQSNNYSHIQWQPETSQYQNVVTKVENIQSPQEPVNPHMQQLTSASLNPDGSVCENKIINQDLYAMLGNDMAVETIGNLTSIPSLPSAVYHHHTNASISNNLAILQGDDVTVAAEETVESMNDDFLVTDNTQTHILGELN